MILIRTHEKDYLVEHGFGNYVVCSSKKHKSHAKRYYAVEDYSGEVMKTLDKYHKQIRK